MMMIMRISQMRRERLGRIRAVAQGRSGLQEIEDSLLLLFPTPSFSLSQLLLLCQGSEPKCVGSQVTGKPHIQPITWA